MIPKIHTEMSTEELEELRKSIIQQARRAHYSHLTFSELAGEERTCIVIDGDLLEPYLEASRLIKQRKLK